MLNSKRLCWILIAGLTLSFIASHKLFYENQALRKDIIRSESENAQQGIKLRDLHLQVDSLTIELRKHREFEEQIRLHKSSRGEMRPRIVSSHSMVATAYGASIMNGGSGYGLVAMGMKPKEGRTIAVDPKLIPLDSKVLVVCDDVPSVNGVYTAEDTGSDILGDRVDIYFDDIDQDPKEARKRMLKFGTKKVSVFVLAAT